MLDNVSHAPKKVLAVASALDNCLALLLTDPESVTAIDSNVTQIYLCKLKYCGIKHLDREEFLILIGVKDGDSGRYYDRIKGYLDEATARYFDERKYLITEVKIVNCGKFEYYFSVFKKKVLPLVHSEKRVEEFMNAADLEEQNRIYDEKFNNLRFRILFKLFFSQAVMKRIGRDKDYFRYNNGSLSALLKRKFDDYVKHNLNRTNPYLQYAVQNVFRSLPTYLEENNYNIIKERLYRLSIVEGDFKDEIRRGEKYDLMYLSDIFEYMSEKETEGLSGYIHSSLNAGGQVMFYNMMNERRLCAPLKEERLDQTYNRAFYYMDCYLYTKENDDR